MRKFPLSISWFSIKFTIPRHTVSLRLPYAYGIKPPGSLAHLPFRSGLADYGDKSNGTKCVAVTGQMVNPPLFESMEIVGKEKVLERVLERVRKAIAILENLKL
jgi:hypothetical protein